MNFKYFSPCTLQPQSCCIAEVAAKDVYPYQDSRTFKSTKLHEIGRIFGEADIDVFDDTPRHMSLPLFLEWLTTVIPYIPKCSGVYQWNIVVLYCVWFVGLLKRIRYTFVIHCINYWYSIFFFEIISHFPARFRETSIRERLIRCSEKTTSLPIHLLVLNARVELQQQNPTQSSLCFFKQNSP